MGRPEERGYPPPQYYYGIRGKKGASLRPDGFLDGSSFAFCRSRDFARTIRHGEKSPDQLSTRPLHAWSAWSSSETVRQPASPAIEHLPITFRNGERLKHGPTIDSPTTLPALCGTKLEATMECQSPWCATSAVLAAMLERERNSYRKCPPNPSVPLEEYAVDRRLMINWCRRLVAECGFSDEIVHTVSLLGVWWGLLDPFSIRGRL